MGLEPTSLSAQEPKSCVSANFTIPAKQKQVNTKEDSCQIVRSENGPKRARFRCGQLFSEAVFQRNRTVEYQMISSGIYIIEAEVALPDKLEGK